MRYAKVNECVAAKLSPAKVESLAKKLAACASEARKMGLIIFGAGEGRLQQWGIDQPLIVASLGSGFDGGRGDSSFNDDGLSIAE